MNACDFPAADSRLLENASGKEVDGTTRLHEQSGYAYDKAWNLSVRTNNALVQTFNVNSLNELTTASRSGTLTVAGSVSITPTSLTVKDNGNAPVAATVYSDNSFARTNVAILNGTNTFTAIAQDSYGRSDTNAVTVNLPAANSFTYDSNGNLLSDGNRYFAYDDENELTSVTVSNAWRSEFSYDGFMRRRIRKEFSWTGSGWSKTNEVRYIYDALLVLSERDANNLPITSYTRGSDLSGELQDAGGIGGLLARTDSRLLIAGDSSATAYYHSDGSGNVTCLASTNNAVVARYSYDPFGSILSMSGPSATVNTYRFSSKEYHANAGLIYYLYRYYDPNLQRWLNSDPLGDISGLVYQIPRIVPWSESGDEDEMTADGLQDAWVRVNRNLYGAIGNNPVNYLDSFGLTCADGTLGPGSINPENIKALAETEEAASGMTQNQIEQAALRRSTLNKIQENKLFGNGLKASRNIDPAKLKKFLNKEELQKAQQIAKEGFKKAAQQLKKVTDPKSRKALIDQLETQLNRENACRNALGK